METEKVLIAIHENPNILIEMSCWAESRLRLFEQIYNSRN